MGNSFFKKLLSAAMLCAVAQNVSGQSWNLVWREDFGVAEDTVIKDFPNASMTVPRHSFAGYESKAHYGSAGYIEYHEQGDWVGDCGFIDDGQYGIANSTWWAYNRFSKCGTGAGHFIGGRDHTGNKNGAMLIVNSEVGTGLPIYTQQINFDLCDSREYKFVVYAASITAYQDDGGNADLELKVINAKNGEEIRNIRTKEIPFWEAGGWGTPNPNDCVNCERNWSEYSCTFKANDGDVLELQVVNWGSGYNDFVIDDISLYRNDTEEIPDPVISATSVSQSSGSKNDCSYLALFSVESSVLAEWHKIYDKVYFLWQQSTDDGVTWTNVKDVSGIDKTDAEIEMDKSKNTIFRVIITGGSTDALAEEQALYIATYGGPKGGCAYYSISNTLSALPKADCTYSDDLLALFVDDFGTAPDGGSVSSPYCPFSFVEKGLSAGDYAVTANPTNTQQNTWDGVPAFSDHTGNADGGMLYCRVNKETGTLYERIVSGPFCECKSYMFSFNAAALGSWSTLYMEGQVLDTKGNILASLPIAQGNGGSDAVWHRYQIDFSPAAGTGNLIFKIVSTDPSTESYGTQVVVDDVSLRVCGMHIPQDSIYINNIPSQTSLTGFDCAEKPVPTVNLSSMSGWEKLYPAAVAVWQTSLDGGLKWTSLSEKGRSVAFDSDGGGAVMYRAVLAENGEVANGVAEGAATEGCGVYLVTNTVTLECTAQCHFNDEMLVLWKDDFGSVPANTRKECSYLKGHKFLKDMKKSVDDGEYAVVSRMQDAGNWFAAMDGTDHTGNADGGFLVINISKSYKDKMIYEQELGFTTCENTSYYFSLWASSISKRVANGDKTGVLCNLTLEIVNAENNEVLASIETGDMPNAESIDGEIPWKNYGVSFVSTGEKVKLRIYDHAGNGDKGNDLALDDISLIACDVTAPNVELAVDGKDDVSGLCGVDEYTLKVGDLKGWNKIYNDDVYCLWQKSEDGGESWENLTEESGLASEKGVLTVTALRNMQLVNDTLVNVGIRYRVIVAGPKSEVTEQIATQGYPDDGCYLYRISNVMTVRCECKEPEFDYVANKFDVCMSEEPIEMNVQQTNTVAIDTVRWFSQTMGSKDWKLEQESVGNDVGAESLHFKVVPTDSVRYLFLAYSEACVSDSIIFTVNVDKPIELEHLASTVLCEGSDTTYKAVVTSGYPLSYVWNGTTSANDEYTISNIATDAVVTLVAKGAVCTSEEKGATVKVEKKVEIITSIAPQEVCAFDEITLDSKAVAENVQWYQSYSGKMVFTKIDGGTNAILACSPDSNRIYKVVASGLKCPSKELSVDVTVKYPAVIEASIDETEYCVGGTSTISVALDHVTSLRWMRKAEGETAFSVFKEGTYSETDTKTSEIVAPEVSTQYLVQTPSEGCAAAQSEVFTVTVEQPVDFTLKADKDMVCKGADDAAVTLNANLISGTAALVEGNAADVMTTGSLLVNLTETTTYTLGITGKLCATKVEKDVTVTVEVPTTFSELKVSETKVCENSAVTFSYTVEPADAPYKLMVNTNNTDFTEMAVENSYVQTASASPRCYKLVSGAGDVCLASESNIVCVEVEDSAKFEFSADKTALCEGAGVTFTVGIPATHKDYKFMFDGALRQVQTQINIENPESKVYTASLAGEVCPKVEKSIEIKVQQPASLSISSNQTSVCVNTHVSIELTAVNALSTQWWSSADGVNYVKFDGDGTNLLPQSDTWYKVTAVGSEMCPGAESNIVAVTVEDSVRYSISEPGAAVCSGEPVSSVITIQSGTPSSVEWKKNDVKIAEVVSLNDVPTEDSNLYTAIVSGTVCPAVSKSFTVAVEQQPTIGEIESCCEVICAGSSVDLSVNAKNAKGLVWTKRTASGTEMSTETEVQTFTDVITETSYYRVSTVGSEICKNVSTKEVRVEAEEKVSVSLPEDLYVCPGSSATIEATVEGNPTQLEWKADGMTLAEHSSSLVVTPSNTTTYSLTAVAKSCATAQDEVSVGVEQVPTVQVGASTDSICEGETVGLDAVGAEHVERSWMYRLKGGGAFYSEMEETAPSITDAPAQSVSYVLQYTTEHGCVATSNEVGVVVSGKVAAMVADTFVCEGGTVPLLARGESAYSYRWYADEEQTQLVGQTSKVSVKPSETTTYYLLVTNGKCKEELSATVAVMDNPKIVALEDRAVREIEVIAEGGGGSYEFNYGQEWTADNLFSGFRFSTQYTIAVRDVVGCKSDTTFRTKTYDIKVPIFFTPNGDGQNDLFEIENISKYPEAKIRIYDRWGKMLLETRSSEYTGWDGTYNGVALPSADYWYEIWVEELARYYTGHFTLVRGK
ncbi:MAG: T9SS type B sorting domain-containing protein [Paludibacteraceae bacterium]|nr:T9SS type B sorting domain-containing protein [Paludibacteraceae bacterium]